MYAVYVEPIPDDQNLSISRSQGSIFEKSKRVANPYDAEAVEYAVKHSSHNAVQGLKPEVAAFTYSTEEDESVLRTALAIGASSAFSVIDPEARLKDFYTKAHYLSLVLKQKNPSAVFFGGRTPDSISNAIAFAVAEILDFKPIYWETDLPPNLTKTVVICKPGTGKIKTISAIQIMKSMKIPIERYRVSDMQQLKDGPALPEVSSVELR